VDSIFITVKTAGRSALDLKIQSYITGEEFLAVLSEIMGKTLPANTKIQAEPIGGILDNTQTLASEGVQTGALLTLL